MTLFEVIKNLSKLNISINSGTKEKLNGFMNLIKLFQIENENLNAYQITDLVTKKTGIINILKTEGTPENISKIDNIEELLNGIRDFTEGQIELVNATGKISEFLEDVALATDFDNDKDPNADKVSLMTIHLAKGLEFPEVFIVGLEEDLFPSAMSLNTREELEEERRLFYVAITRAKEKAYITYAQSRYRWGKLIDAEPSRFIEEIDPKFVEKEYPDRHKTRSLVDASIFGSYKKNNKEFNSISKPKPNMLSKLKSLNIIQKSDKNSDYILNKLVAGMDVAHGRFGNGKVLSIEGSGDDKKAAIDFKGFGIKNLLVRFAKLKILNLKS